MHGKAMCGVMCGAGSNLTDGLSWTTSLQVVCNTSCALVGYGMHVMRCEIAPVLVPWPQSFF